MKTFLSKGLGALALLFTGLACNDVTTETSSSGSTTGNPCYPDSCTGPGGPTTSVTTGATSTSGAGGGALCGTLAGLTCGPDEYCDYGNDQCGGDDGSGTCTPKPTACDDHVEPACACDGKVYGNPCDANAAGVDVNGAGGCPAPMNTFACGFTYCSFDSYCERQTSDVGGEPTLYACKPLPTACGGVASCACVANEPCGGLCMADAGGHVTATCPGG